MSQRHSEYEPVPGDNYYTPAWVTEALLGEEQFPGISIWEPASGGGHMVDAICDLLGNCTGTDIADGHDFLKAEEMPENCISIITNPPYSHGLANQFVRHAINLTEPVEGKVAMLLPLSWDSAKGRRDLFAEHPAFKIKYTLTKRIRWENLEQKKNGPSQNHSWFVWDWQNKATPKVGYLP